MFLKFSGNDGGPLWWAGSLLGYLPTTEWPDGHGSTWPAVNLGSIFNRALGRTQDRWPGIKTDSRTAGRPSLTIKSPSSGALAAD